MFIKKNRITFEQEKEKVLSNQLFQIIAIIMVCKLQLVSPMK